MKAFLCTLVAFFALWENTSAEEEMELWYTRPAKEWTEAQPIGNGRLAAMVFGGISQERIQINEDTLWGGGPYDPSNSEALKALPEVRQLVFDEQYQEAQALAGKMMARPIRQMPYQTVGDLRLQFPGHDTVTDYRRSLNIDTAITRTSYKCNGVTYTREVFASPVDQVIIIRITSDMPAKVNFTALLSSPQLELSFDSENKDILIMKGRNGQAQRIAGALSFQCRVKTITDGGTVTSDNNATTVKNANSAILFIAAATSFKSWKDVSGDPEKLCRAYIEKIGNKPYEKIRNDHVEEHQRLFRRVRLDLGTSEAMKLPTDERIRKFDFEKDPQLVTLFFQFGRYLMMSSSRPGCQPANLRGIWNDSLRPPWDSKYTININTEMSYWLAEPLNLAECHEPLIQMVKELAESGQRTARTNYGARGWVCHHNTDLWRASAPIDSAFYGLWPCGGAWLCQHLWYHYEYNPDKEFLKEAYPIWKGAAQFFLDSLVEHPKNKWLVTCPSMSPELAHRPRQISICAGPSMDMQIIRDLFSICVKASEILDTDKDFRKQCTEAQQRLVPHQVGGHGQLQEWLDDWDRPNDRHRHLSHLYALYPSNQITPKTPDLFKAARKSLEIRGDDGAGFTLAWKANLWARLHEGDRVHEILMTLIGPGKSYPNMFDSYPPFVIDGNFGGPAAIAEILLQSHSGELFLLPALPSAWPKGSIRGLRARGGYEVDIQWDKGRLVNARLKAGRNGVVRVRSSADLVVTLQDCQIPTRRPDKPGCEFTTEAGKTYDLTPK